MSKTKTRIGDIARAAGVSTATVDRVLNGRGGVKPEKEERIIEAARALGFDRALSDRPARTLRIGVLIQAPLNPFHAALRQGLSLAAQMYSALNMQMLVQHIDPRDATATAALIRSLIGERNGLIVCLPADPRIAEMLTCFSTTAPVITLATDIADSGRRLFVGPDDFKSGRAAGDLMGLLMRPQGGHVLMVAGTLHMYGQRQREAGFRNMLQERYPETQLVRVLETGEDGETAGRMVEIALDERPHIRGIYHSSVGALQIANALEFAGVSNDVFFISHELTPNRRMLLAARRLHAIIDQNPMLEARLAIEAMARLLGRLPGEATHQKTETRIFMAENV